MATNRLETLERQYEEARAKVIALESQLSRMPKDHPERRKTVADKDAWVAYQRDLKIAVGEMNRKQSFAGLGSPLHEALLERFENDEPTIDALEERAVALQEERDARAAARRAAKEAAKAAGDGLTPARAGTKKIA